MDLDRLCALLGDVDMYHLKEGFPNYWVYFPIQAVSLFSWLIWSYLWFLTCCALFIEKMSWFKLTIIFMLRLSLEFWRLGRACSRMPECFTDNGGYKHDGSNIAPETTPEIIRPNFSCNRNFRRNSHRKWTGNWHLWDHRSNVLSTKNTFLCHNISTTSFDKIADYCFTSIWKTL